MRSNSAAYSREKRRESQESLGVAHRQAGLKAIDRRVGGEPRRREPKLSRRRNVLGVIDDQQFAARLRPAPG